MTLIRPVIIIESPMKGNYELNACYLNLCIRHSVLRGEAPIATHKLYVGPFDDTKPVEREVGMSIISSFIKLSTLTAVYYDVGISPGMQWGMVQARKAGKLIEPRSLFNHPIPQEWNAICEQIEKEAAQ